jgi:hypothetical protein
MGYFRGPCEVFTDNDDHEALERALRWGVGLSPGEEMLAPVPEAQLLPGCQVSQPAQPASQPGGARVV